MILKTCSRCKTPKGSNMFYRRRIALDGLQNYCKQCNKDTHSVTPQESSSGLGILDAGKVGAACELLVLSDLLSRGFEVTRPCNPAALHDLHVDIPSVGWVGVQVKATKRNPNTDKLTMSVARRSIQSPLLAMVYLRAKRIEYCPGTKNVPQELL